MHLNIDIIHSATSSDCPTYLHHIEVVRRSVNYANYSMHIQVEIDNTLALLFFYEGEKFDKKNVTRGKMNYILRLSTHEVRQFIRGASQW